MKKIILSLILGLIFSVILSVHSQSIHSDISSNILRLHIIAAGDSAEEQSIKLAVRDRILREISPLFENARSPEECRKIAADNINRITAVANDELEKNGADYRAKAYLGQFFFPTKTYGNIMLPKGRYNAVRVELGSGEGKNWWCVMFPPLCFANETTGELPQKERDMLKERLNSESYSIITNNGELDLKIKFKILELFEK